MKNLQLLGNSRLKQVWFLEVLNSSPKVLIFVPMLILGVGATLSLFVWPSSFQRSGAVLVCVTIFGVYLNHYIGQEITVNKTMRGTMGSFGGLEERKENFAEIEVRYNFILANNPGIDRDDARKSAITSFLSEGAFVDKFKLVQHELYVLQDRVVFLEVLSGTLGTLVWAFGDLPFLIS